MIGRSLVQIPAPGKAELHVEVSLSEILNPTLLICEGPTMRWRLVQGVPLRFLHSAFSAKVSPHQLIMFVLWAHF